MKRYYLQKKIGATIRDLKKAFSGYYMVFMNYVVALPFTR